MAQNCFKVTVRYSHRKWGPQRWETKTNAAKIGVAIGRALRLFFTQGTRGDRLIAHRKITVEATRLGKAVA